MWINARGQNAEQAHVVSIKVEMKWTGMWRAMKQLRGLAGGSEF